MKFVKEDIRLLIKQKDELKYSFAFKAYLEKSDVQVKLIDTNLQYAPLNFTNNTQLIKTQYSVDFSFNVFAEDEDEAKTNYVQLHNLLATIKPSYTRISGQLIPNSTNIFGLITLKFRGLPRLSARPDLDIYVTNFTYEINKDMGFFDTDAFSDKNLLLTPIAYKVGIAGRVLLPLDEAVNITNVSYNSTTGVVAAEPAPQPTQAPTQQETLQPAAPADAPKTSTAITENKKPAGGNTVKKQNGGGNKKTIYDAFVKAGGGGSATGSQLEEFTRVANLLTYPDKNSFNTYSYDKKVKMFSVLLQADREGYLDKATGGWVIDPNSDSKTFMNQKKYLEEMIYKLPRK